MRRVLRKGGRIVINDRSVPEDDFIDEALNRLDALHDESHVRQYRASEWEEMLTRHGFRVDICELYSKSRPLASLTKGVRERDVRTIHEILRSLTRAQQESLGYENSGGGPVINHWYVLITGRLSGLG